jgi:hypothetical protein
VARVPKERTKRASKAIYFRADVRVFTGTESLFHHGKEKTTAAPNKM